MRPRSRLSVALVAIEQDLREAVHQIVAAYQANDTDRYLSFYAADMTVLRAAGRWTREG
jgi:ketosteroid isomerase-like protein